MAGIVEGQVALVTGANGFLGSHLVRTLADAGCRVHVLLRENSDEQRLAGIAGLTRWKGDLRDEHALAACCMGAQPHTVYHMAGHTAGRRFDGDWTQVDKSISTNLQGTLNLVRAIAQHAPSVSCFVRLGGLEEYGLAPPPFREDQREAPRSPYSASQVAATHFLQALQPHIDFSLVTLRPVLIYGPGQSEDFMIPALIRALLKGEPFPLSSGVQRRDLLHVDDLVAAALAAFGRQDLRGALLNVGTGKSHMIRSVARKIADIVGRPDLIRIGALPDRTAEILDLRCDTTAIRAQLDWRPRIALDQGLRDLVEWHRNGLVVA
jgi:UDP-glucose 4-epimerase